MSNLGPREPNNDMVICPNCTCQFVAIPVNVQTRLAHIADIAHAGGLAGLTTEDAMTFIRRLTIQHWNKTGYEDAMRDRVLDAARAADGAGEEHGSNN